MHFEERPLIYSFAGGRKVHNYLVLDFIAHMSPVNRVCGLILTQPRSQALSPLTPLSDAEKREPGNEANTNCHLLATSLALCYAEIYEFHPSSTLSLDTVLRYVSRGRSLIPNVSLVYFPF